jgi:hypothetical protein
MSKITKTADYTPAELAAYEAGSGSGCSSYGAHSLADNPYSFIYSDAYERALGHGWDPEALRLAWARGFRQGRKDAAAAREAHAERQYQARRAGA